jgi:hypothetical protein
MIGLLRGLYGRVRKGLARLYGLFTKEKGHVYIVVVSHPSQG